MATQIRFGGYQGAASVHTRAIAVFARALEERLGDAVAIEVVGNVGQLGHKAADLLALVESGAFDLCYFSSSYLTGRVPALGVLTCRSRSTAASASMPPSTAPWERGSGRDHRGDGLPCGDDRPKVSQ